MCYHSSLFITKNILLLLEKQNICQYTSDIDIHFKNSFFSERSYFEVNGSVFCMATDSLFVIVEMHNINFRVHTFLCHIK